MKAERDAERSRVAKSLTSCPPSPCQMSGEWSLCDQTTKVKQPRKPMDCHISTFHILCKPSPFVLEGKHMVAPLPGTHHNDKDNRASKTPDEGFVDRDPAEVRVPIALGIQANSKALEREGEGLKGYLLELKNH